MSRELRAVSREPRAVRRELTPRAEEELVQLIYVEIEPSCWWRGFINGVVRAWVTTTVLAAQLRLRAGQVTTTVLAVAVAG